MTGFGKRLDRLMRRAGYTQPRLAEALGCAKNSVYRWRHDLSEPSMYSLVMLKRVLGCTWRELMGE